MIAYVKCMIEELADLIQRQEVEEAIQSRFKDLLQEVEELHAHDFQLDHRNKFITFRRRLRTFAAINDDEWKQTVFQVRQKTPYGDGHHAMLQRKLLNRLELPSKPQFGNQAEAEQFARVALDGVRRVIQEGTAILDGYLGSNVIDKARVFGFMTNSDLRTIVERDYTELQRRLYPAEAWKSVVIICGSILEALLHDLLTRDQARVQAAMTTAKGPKKGKPPNQGRKDITSDNREDEWTLFDYIEVANELGLLPTGWAAGVHAVLRDFRNYVHPRRESKEGRAIDQGEAMMSMGTLIVICDHLEKNP
jgi:hypothetical protein